MRTLLAFLFLFAATPSSAGMVPTRFVGNFLVAAQLSIRQDPFYASRLMDSFNRHLVNIAPSSSAEQVCNYLKGEIWGRTGSAPSIADAKRLSEELGTEVLDPQKAGAILLANAFASPGQFKEVLTGLEAMKPGLGKGLNRSMGDAAFSHKAHPALGILLAQLATQTAPSARNGIYDAKGRLDALFDNAR